MAKKDNKPRIKAIRTLQYVTHSGFFRHLPSTIKWLPSTCERAVS